MQCTIWRSVDCAGPTAIASATQLWLQHSAESVCAAAFIPAAAETVAVTITNLHRHLYQPSVYAINLTLMAAEFALYAFADGAWMLFS